MKEAKDKAELENHKAFQTNLPPNSDKKKYLQLDGKSSNWNISGAVNRN